VAKRFDVTITDTSLALTRRADQVTAEAALDGIYVIRINVPASTLGAPATVVACKYLAHLERTSARSRPTAWICARSTTTSPPTGSAPTCRSVCWPATSPGAYGAALAELTYTDEGPPARDNPIAPAARSPAAQRKADRHPDAAGQPPRSFPGLLDHMAALTRDTIALGQATFDKITILTPTQQRAFELIATQR
jgi:hypothetical protein